MTLSSNINTWFKSKEKLTQTKKMAITMKIAIVGR